MPPAKLRLLMIAENADDGMPRQVRPTSSIGRKELASHTEGAISESLVLRHQCHPRRHPANTAPVARPVVYRHGLPTRIWHWLNAAVILVMLMTGLMIFNAHPRLYWGQYGANPDYSWLQIGDRDRKSVV